jgi:hypothetical protein
MLEKNQENRISWVELSNSEFLQVDYSHLHQNEMLFIQNQYFNLIQDEEQL